MTLGREQLAAASLAGGPVRVVAGAGTGKTAVIAERFRRLVAAGSSPSSILVMTFTDRAAAEMRERIESLTGSAAPAVGTLHALALSWLRAGVRPAVRRLRARVSRAALPGLRRPADARGKDARAAPGGPQRLPGEVSARPGRRVPGPEPRAGTAGRAAGRGPRSVRRR